MSDLLYTQKEIDAMSTIMLLKLIREKSPRLPPPYSYFIQYPTFLYTSIKSDTTLEKKLEKLKDIPF
jgi:hypothetical protein